MTSASYYQAILPVIDVQKQIKPAEIIPVSPSNITYYTIPAVGTSSGQQSNSNIVFNIIPPVSDAGGVTPNVFNSPYCGFASFPINSIFSTLTLQINNACKMDPSMDYAQTTNFIQSPFGCFADDMLSRNAYDIVYVSNPTVPARFWWY
jgi:hypothetical protein